MFILVFVVSFGAKKGTLASYATYWYTSFYENFLTRAQNLKKNLTLKELSKSNRYRFQFTVITTRTTIYLLFVFWCFFFTFGEFLLLLTFNFNNLNDLIPSGFFNFIKTHVVFLLDNSTASLNNTIFFYILFFTSCSFIFLLNLRYTMNVAY